MSWGYGHNKEGREIGYTVEAVCDEDGCNKEIDRGLAYVCGEMHDGGEHGCGKYFCYDHLLILAPEQLCPTCCDKFHEENPDWLEEQGFGDLKEEEQEETCGFCNTPCGNDWCVTKQKEDK